MYPKHVSFLVKPRLELTVPHGCTTELSHSLANLEVFVLLSPQVL